MSASEVIEGRRRWWAEQGDAADWLHSLPNGCADLIVCSPPYEKARLYLESGEDLRIARSTEEWVAWLVKVCLAMRHACKGLCVLVVEGQTQAYRYSAGPLLLAADLHRLGFHLRKPPIYRRVGIPGSGGPDWWRNDYEFCLCFTRGGKLPWSDNTATGHPPRWAPGGAMSHRMNDGKRINAFGVRRDEVRVGARRPNGAPATTETPDYASRDVIGQSPADDAPLLFEGGDQVEKPTTVNEHGLTGAVEADHEGRTIKKKGRPGGKPFKVKRSKIQPGHGGTETTEGHYEWSYVPPVLANPGNVIDCKVGGGQMGDPLAHENEAPFPEELVEPFVRCFCPEGGLVLDPFCGSGTTLAVALKWGRRALGCDLRQSQVELTHRRMAGVVSMFDAPEGA